MAVRGIEGAVDALIDYLVAQSPAKIAALNAEYADDIELADFAHVYDSEQVESATYPYLEVIGVTADPSHEMGNSVTQQLTIAILCWIEDQSSNSNLKRRGYRYARALLELAKESRRDASMSGYTATKLGPLDFQPLRWNRARTRVLGSIIVSVKFNCTEAYP